MWFFLLIVMRCPVFSTGIIIVLLGVADSLTRNNASYVGCFDPGYSLARNYHYHMPHLTLDKCITKCVSSSTKYAGVEASDNFCYCGADIAEESVKRDDSQCNVPCPGVDTTCGGDWLISVYDISAIESPDAERNRIERLGVGFLIGLSVGVRLYNSSRMDTYDTVMTTQDWAYSVDYHYAENLVFVFSKGKLYRTSLKSATAQATPVLVGAVSTCDAFAVDWVRDKIYWANCINGVNKIMSMELNGENATELLQRPEETVSIKRMEVDPYKGVIFWSADGTIESCELDGNNFQTNLSAPGVGVRSLALDLAPRRVYYVGAINHTSSLFSMDYDGGAMQEHYSLPQMKSVYGMSLLRGQVYWVNYANVRDVIYTAPLPTDGSGTPTVQMLRIIDRAVWHMRVVHPDLQRRPRRDPCQDMGCEHLCTTITSALARCQCPPGQELNTDGVSCSVLARAAEPSVLPMWVGAVTGGLLLVAAVVLVSALFVYLGDHYWSHLQTKLLSIPYARNRGTDRDQSVTPVYERGDDHVNLI